MSQEHTTAAVQRYLDDLAGDSPAEPIVRGLLDRAVRRLHVLCATLLFRSYPRLTHPPLNLQADELLSAVAERLLKAMREARPRSVRQFFALANQHMRWELNELARRLDEVLAQGAGASLRQRRGAGRRPEALRRGTADPGSALGLGRAVMALGPAQPGGGSARSDGAGPVRAGPWRRVVAGAAAVRAARGDGTTGGAGVAGSGGRAGAGGGLAGAGPLAGGAGGVGGGAEPAGLFGPGGTPLSRRTTTNDLPCWGSASSRAARALQPACTSMRSRPLRVWRKTSAPPPSQRRPGCRPSRLRPRRRCGQAERRGADALAQASTPVVAGRLGPVGKNAGQRVRYGS